MLGHWICNFSFDVNENISFVYKITFSDNRFYIGYKKFWVSNFEIPSKPNSKQSNWKTYSGSSKTVNELLKHDTATFEILKVFDNLKDSYEYEYNLIRETYSENLNINRGLNIKDVVEHELIRSKRTRLQMIRQWKDESYRTKICEKFKGRIPVNKGIKKTQEQCEEMSKRTKELWNTNCFREKTINGIRIGQARWMASLTPEQWKERYRLIGIKSSISQKGKKLSEAHKAKLKVAARNRPPMTKEHKEAISKSLQQYSRTKEHIENNRLANIGKKKRQIKKLIIDGVSYKSIRQASIQLNMNGYSIHKLLTNKDNIIEYKDSH